MHWLGSRPALRAAHAALLALGLAVPETGAADANARLRLTEPVAARNADGHLEVFCVDAEGQLRHRWQKLSNGDWSSWSSLGGPFEPGIAVVFNAAAELEVFAVNSERGELCYAHQTAANSADWSPWFSLRGAVQGPAAVASQANGRLHVFAVAPGGAAKHRWQTNAAGGWTGWADLGGELLPGLAAARNLDGRIEIFGIRAADSALVHCWQRDPTNPAEWTSWTSLGGQVLPGFAVGHNGVGRLEVFAIARLDRALQRSMQVTPGNSSKWTDWQDFNGSVPPGLGAVPSPATRADQGLPETEIAGRGSADTVHPEVSALEPGLVLGQSADGRVEVFAVDSHDHALLHRWEMYAGGTDAWSRWASMGIAAQPYPAVIANEEGDLEVFAVDARDSSVLNHRRQISRASDWLDWSSLDQPNFRYSSRTWQTDDGLPDNVVQALAQSSDGYLWVGTLAGLARFDGLTFTAVAPLTAPELQNASITALCADRSGALWIGTDGYGLVRLQAGTFSHFGKTNGLAGDFLRAIYQTRDGSLWIGTTTGMSRYSQGAFTTYTHHQGLLSDVVRALHEDRAGNLWIATGAGLNRLSPVSGLESNVLSRAAIDATPGAGTRTQDSRLQTQDFRMDAFRMPNNLPNDSVRCIWQDKGGRVWIGSNNGLLWYNWFWMHSFYAYNTKYGLSDPFVSAICEDHEGNLWVGTYSGLNRFHEGRFYSELNDEGVPFDRINALLEDHGGNLWVGCRDGLARLTPKHFRTYTRQQGLTHNNVMSVLQDRSGSLWLGTWGGGLNQLKDEKVTAYITTGTNAANVVTETAGTNRFPESLVLSLDEGHDGSLWVGADYDGGLTRLKDGQMTRFTWPGGVVNAPVRVIHEDRAGALWLGTSRGLYRLQDGQFAQFTTTNNLAGDLVRAICEDHAGRLWIGTDAGLSLWQGGRSPQSKVLSLESKVASQAAGPEDGGAPSSVLPSRFTTIEGLSDDHVRALYEDKEHNLWIGTSTGGLNRINLSEIPDGAAAGSNAPSRITCHVSRFTTHQGLFSDEVFEILEDDQGWLWLTCSKGISRVRKHDLEAVEHGDLRTVASPSYGKGDGLETTQCNGAAKPAAWKAGDGRLWFATSKGVACVDPATLEASSAPPRVFIEQVLTDKKPLVSSSSPWGAGPLPADDPEAGPLTVAAGRGELEFHYTALDFQAPEDIRFKYRLEGVDSEWVDAGTRRTAHYNYVSPGTHRFEVIACNKDGLWNTEGASITLLLRPHLWQTWWYRALGGLLIAAVAAGAALYFTRRRMRRQLQLLEQRHAIERERGRIAKDIHDDLGSSLTRILMLGERAADGLGKPDDLSAHVGKIVTTARGTIQALDEIVWAVNPENDSLEGLVEYISHYADEFFENTPVACRLKFPAQLPASTLTAEVRHDLFLIVKEAFNNILKHSRASEVHVEVSAADSKLQVIIEDNGRGFDPAKPASARKGNGLHNMRQRAQNLGGQFAFTSSPGRGARIMIHTPLKPNARPTRLPRTRMEH